MASQILTPGHCTSSLEDLTAIGHKFHPIKSTGCSVRLAVEGHTGDTTVREHTSRQMESLTTLNAKSEDATGIESQDEGAIAGDSRDRGDHTVAAINQVATSQIMANDANFNNTQSGSSLTVAAITAHNHYLTGNLSFDQSHASSRVDGIVRAARELGIDLPRECFEWDSWTLTE